MGNGIIEILSGNGHDEVALPEDRTEAKAKVEDMIKKGYALFIKAKVKKTEGEGENAKEIEVEEDKKVTGYDADTGEYLCDVTTTKTVTETNTDRFPSSEYKATAVAPIAGG